MKVIQQVQEAWNNGRHDVMSYLSEVQNDSIIFNRETFGNIFNRKKNVETRIKGIYRCLET